MDFAPAWSPNGSQIAFVRRFDRDRCGNSFGRVGIHTIRDNGQGIRKVVDIPSRNGEGTPKGWDASYHSGPVWSSDGQLLAYVVNERERVKEMDYVYYYRDHTVLFIVNADGSDLKRVLTFSSRGVRERARVTSDEDLKRVGLFSEEQSRSIVSLPKWSPDDQHIAFVRVADGVPKLYTIGRDGSNLHEVVELENPGVGGPELGQTRRSVFWSRDGSHITFPWGRTLYSVNTDGSDLRSIHEGDYFSPSPDGSRIAHFVREDVSGVVLYTMAPDGSDVWALARRGKDFVVEAIGPELRPFAHAASCSAGVVVPDPETNAGLVRDCEALVEIVGLIGVAGLNWEPDTPIAEWEGVSLDDPNLNRQTAPKLGESLSPLRVRGLSLPGHGLVGPFPLKVTELLELQELDLSNNALEGAIPPELDRLTSLHVLKLNDNTLSGPVPSDIGRLTKLRALHLGGNRLIDVIPPELGGLTELEELDLSRNRLSGVIPPELGKLAALETLNLSENKLKGPVAPELGNLTALETLDLGFNNLFGAVPPELGNLTALETLDLGFNNLSGAVPPELGNLTALETLDLVNNLNLSGCMPLALAGRGIGYQRLDYCDP